jgi:hypothetical protein
VNFFCEECLLEFNNWTESIKIGGFKIIKKYKNKTMTLHNKLKGSFKVYGHEGTNLIFYGFNAPMLKHFTIGLLLELWQQLKYEQVVTIDEMAKVVKKNEENMKEVL